MSDQVFNRNYNQILEEQSKLAMEKYGMMDKKRKPSSKEKKEFDSAEYYLNQAKEKLAMEKAKTDIKEMNPEINSEAKSAA